MNIQQVARTVAKMGACGDAVGWLESLPADTTLDDAWRQCERGDWMLWLLGRLSGGPRSKSRRRLVLASCGCARLSLKYVPAGEKRPLRAIQTAERWTRGNATLAQVRAAAYDAYDAYDAYADAAVAVAVAAGAAAAVAYAAARRDALAACADIVRKHFPRAPKIGKG